MQDFNDWMHSLRHDQQHHAAMSVASSWTETDCESESEGEDMAGCLLLKRGKHAPSSRTAPIAIPAASRRPSSPVSDCGSPDLSFHEAERLSRAGFGGYSDDDVDEDDPAFYGNLAFFRSRRSGRTVAPRPCSRAVPIKTRSVSTPSTVDADQDIFDLEL